MGYFNDSQHEIRVFNPLSLLSLIFGINCIRISVNIFQSIFSCFDSFLSQVVTSTSLSTKAVVVEEAGRSDKIQSYVNKLKLVKSLLGLTQ